MKLQNVMAGTGSTVLWTWNLGVNQNIFWLPRDVDPKMKLVLAATLTAVLKHK